MPGQDSIIGMSQKGILKALLTEDFTQRIEPVGQKWQLYCIGCLIVHFI